MCIESPPRSLPLSKLQVSSPQQRHQPAYRSATTYHYSSPSTPSVATTGGTVADAALALPGNSFNWQQRQRENFGFQGWTITKFMGKV